MVKLLKLARLQFLVAGMALYGFGALLAVVLGAPFSAGRFLLGACIVLPAQLAVNFSNDYFDVEADQPEGGTFISGGSSILLQFPELRKPALRIAAGLTLLSLGMGLVFVRTYSLPFRWMGWVALGNLLGWAYSAPPLRLSYRGLGELSFTFVSGFLLPAMGWLSLRGSLEPAGGFFLFPLVCYGLVFILSVEIPDMEADHLGGKRTWIARCGRKFGFTLVGSLLLAASAYFFLLALYNPPLDPIDLRVAGWLSLLPVLPGLWGLVSRPVSREAATRVATGIVLLLSLFAVLLDAYLFFLIRPEEWHMRI